MPSPIPIPQGRALALLVFNSGALVSLILPQPVPSTLSTAAPAPPGRHPLSTQLTLAGLLHADLGRPVYIERPPVKPPAPAALCKTRVVDQALGNRAGGPEGGHIHQCPRCGRCTAKRGLVCFCETTVWDGRDGAHTISGIWCACEDGIGATGTAEATGAA